MVCMHSVRRLSSLPLAALIAGFALPGCSSETGSGPAAGAARAGSGEQARVDRVVDGDTLKVRLPDGRRKTVRVLGIDTPETKKPNTPVECGGPQATAAMARLALSGSGYSARGRDVVLISDPTGDQVDRFGRILAYVEADGRDLGEQLVAQGWAESYAYRGRNFQRRSRYEQAQLEAGSDGRGVHGSCGGNFHFAGGD